jgi:hypothetical protein
MTNPIFLLGAGFNYDAKEVAGKIIGQSIYYGKYEMNCKYPLGSEMGRICFPGEQIQASSSVEERLNDSIKNRNYGPVGLLYDAIMQADYLLAPKLLKPHSNCYTTFLDKFKESSFLTFNYDSLVELFLLKLGYWYPHDGYGVPVEVSLPWNIETDDVRKADYLKKQSKSLVIHLHGSLCIYIQDIEVCNNLIELKENPTFKFDPNSITKLFYPYEKARMDLSYSPNLSERVIAPIPDKTEGLKKDFISLMYHTGQELLKTSTMLIVIGYNFSLPDICSYHKLLCNWEGNSLIISPNATELTSRMESEFPEIEWDSRPISFKKWADDGFVI